MILINADRIFNFKSYYLFKQPITSLIQYYHISNLYVCFWNDDSVSEILMKFY